MWIVCIRTERSSRSKGKLLVCLVASCGEPNNLCESREELCQNLKFFTFSFFANRKTDCCYLVLNFYVCYNFYFGIDFEIKYLSLPFDLA